MKIMGLEVTIDHAADGQPDDSSCCAIALALKDNYYPEDHMHVEVNSDGSITVLSDVPARDSFKREELFSLYPMDEEEEDNITGFINHYDEAGTNVDYTESDWKFPYHFSFVRKDNA